MRRFMGLMLAGGIVLGMAGESKAQFALSVGNPYYGSGFALGAPGYGYPGYGYPGYGGAVYPGYVRAPGAFAYSSGYRGYAPVAPYAYSRPIATPYYGGYGYPAYGYGVRRGFRPFAGYRRY